MIKFWIVSCVTLREFYFNNIPQGRKSVHKKYTYLRKLGFKKNYLVEHLAQQVTTFNKFKMDCLGIGILNYTMADVFVNCPKIIVSYWFLKYLYPC